MNSCPIQLYASCYSLSLTLEAILVNRTMKNSSVILFYCMQWISYNKIDIIRGFVAKQGLLTINASLLSFHLSVKLLSFRTFCILK